MAGILMIARTIKDQSTSHKGKDKEIGKKTEEEKDRGKGKSKSITKTSRKEEEDSIPQMSRNIVENNKKENREATKQDMSIEKDKNSLPSRNMKREVIT